MPMPQDQYARLRAYLAVDPDNPALIADTARAALAAGDDRAAATLADRHDDIAGPGPDMAHLRGLIAMARQDWAAAGDAFERLIALGIDPPPVRFNLAWSLAMAGRRDAALALLDDAVVATLPAAAQLQVGLLHEAGDLDTAAAAATAAIARFPDHAGLNADVSTLAIDLEEWELARTTAMRAGAAPAALVTRGVLAMDAGQVDGAAALFDDALARQPDNARALIGRGLVALHRGLYHDAAETLDRAATAFGTHLGSWIAAGWAWLLAGERDAARARFERALTIDDSFADAHGSLAVLNLIAGDHAAGRRRAEIAERLDRRSFSAMLAATILASGTGDGRQAQAIVDGALATPVDEGGRTIAQLLVRLRGGG